MKTNPTQPLRHLLDRAQKRFIRSRPGSVLILVVALLVMMALIGTAYMTMAQFDRGTAIVHSFNTEVDLLLDGVVNQVKGTIANDPYSSGQFRPAVTIQTSTGFPVHYNTPYNNAAARYWNGLGLDTGAAAVINGATPATPTQAGDSWLASRVPGLFQDTVAPNLTTNVPLWPFISGPINGGAVFDTPVWPGGASPTQYTGRTQLYPTKTGGFTGNSVLIDGQVWPAWGTPGTANWIMAADADGDGIADSGLSKLLTLDGVTYYAAVRIVDNAAAINASIALTPNPVAAYTPGTQMPGDLSPVNLDLEGMTVNPLSTYSNWNAPTDLYGSTTTKKPVLSSTGPGLLYNFRFNSHVPDPTVNPQFIDAVDENGAQRTDFLYMPYPITYPGTVAGTVQTGAYYYFDQQWLELARRLRNPGRLVLSTANPNDPSTFFQALPISDSIAMARNFILRDPTVTSSASSSSILEKMMPNTTYQSPYYQAATITTGAGGPSAPYQYPTVPYQPGDTFTWFLQNFYYWYDFAGLRGGPVPPNPPNQSPTMPMRALLTAQNPVSNFAPAKFNMTPTPPYQFGDVVTDPNTGFKYVCLNPGTTATPLPPDPYWQDPNWAWEPWTNAPTKTSVNSGTFQQLYAAYWAVMADQYVPATNQWAPAFPNVTGNPSSFRMFRNPIRDNALDGSPTTKPASLLPGVPPALSNQQVMDLRSALAAVNTIALRHGDAARLQQYGTNDVVSRTIPLPTTVGGGMACWATVYGVERQPFITQVFAINDPDQANDWIAVELYNPYPVAIQLKNWTLAVIDRTTNPQKLTMQPLGGNAGDLNAQAPGFTSIGPNQRVVLMSNMTPPSTVQIGTATPPTNQYYSCPALADATNGVFNKELVLLRPRRADGTLTSTTGMTTPPPNNAFAEALNGNGLYDMVPVDSYDFTNFDPTAAVGTPPQPQIWWYRRPNDPTAQKRWHWVFPGPWHLASAAGGPAPQPGTKQPNWSGTCVITSPQQGQIDASGLGLPAASQNPPGTNGSSPLGTVPWANYEDTAIQLANVDFGGPNKPTAGAANSLPLGTFMRNGDILQVTFIGSYKIWTGGATTAYATGNAAPFDGAQQMLELNPVTADSAMATAFDSTDGTNAQEPLVSNPNNKPVAQIIAENVGRFCPIDIDDSSPTGVPVNDFDIPTTPVPGSTMPSAKWRYRWATRVFDFLTVQAPNDDYFPNVDPWMEDAATPPPSSSAYGYRYSPTASAGAANPVANVTPGASNSGLQTPTATITSSRTSEDTAPVDGLVNINTAPWRVLAAIPWFPATMPNYRIQNATFAAALAHYRDIDDGSGAVPPHGHGPFRNVFELGNATILGTKVRNLLGAANASQFTPAQGNLAPLNGKADVQGDFQAQFNEITRLSNLVTTRSDSYTAYVLIQGWRNAETPNPHLVVQRRAAVIIDRSNVTPNNRSPNAVNVPMN